MTGGATGLTTAGLPAALREAVLDRLAAALTALGLDGFCGTVCLAADDLPGDEEAWYRMLPGSAEQPGPVLMLHCHPESFCRHRPLKSTVHPPRAVWDQMEAPRSEAFLDPAEFSAERTDIFLHHHLQTVADLNSGELQDLDLPVRLAEGFAAAWAVTVDGRLERAHLPGYPMAERRGRFSRLFSAAGILLPEHWQIFQALWDGALEGRGAVLDAVRQLPRL